MRGCSDQKKKLGAGDVYSIIDGDVMMTQLQIGCLSHQGFSLYATPAFPRDTKEEGDRWWIMTMGEWINDYESCNKFIMPHLMYEME